ncbi:MAG TPA: lysophospholipid acyltransferase family protein [Vicinamibacterales bacterium]|nr:lysophospholipid acyltransferase family protein [Vicinamibacterales bacterium]
MTLPPFHWWRTVFLLIPAIACYTIALGALSLVVGLVDRRGVATHRCAQWWARLILWTSRVRIELRGQPLPPAGASCVFVANHSSIYDTPILFSALAHQLRVMAKATLGYVPFIGWHLARSGHLLVNRKNPGAAILKKMQRMIGQGASLMVFPEASRSSDGRLKPFKPGIFLLAIESGLPIVPVSVVGSRVVMPKGRLMVCPATVQVILHESVPTKGLTRRDTRALAERVRAIVGSAVPGSGTGVFSTESGGQVPEVSV